MLPQFMAKDLENVNSFNCSLWPTILMFYHLKHCRFINKWHTVKCSYDPLCPLVELTLVSKFTQAHWSCLLSPCLSHHCIYLVAQHHQDILLSYQLQTPKAHWPLNIKGHGSELKIKFRFLFRLENYWHFFNYTSIKNRNGSKWELTELLFYFWQWYPSWEVRKASTTQY